MTENDKKLALALKIKFGLAPMEPTEEQLRQIKYEIELLVSRGLEPRDNDWLEIIRRTCKGAGLYFYGSVDNSDLNTLLKLATK